MAESLKIWGGEKKCSGHNLPLLVEIGLTNLPKSGDAKALPPVAPSNSDSPAQYDPCHLPLVAFLQQLLGPVMSRDFQPFLLSLSLAAPLE